MKNIKEVVAYLNTFNNYQISTASDDGRVNSLTSEDSLVKTITNNLSTITNIDIISKTSNRDENDFNIVIKDDLGDVIFSEGTDIKIVDPQNFTNTVSFVKLSKMINLSGNSYETVIKNYNSSTDIKLTSDYSILFFDKTNNKFIQVYLSEMSKNDVTTNPSNCIQTKIPTSIISRTEEEKFNFIHSLWKSYIYKRVVAPAKLCESIDFSDIN
jgi:hypothetical protein